MREKNKILYNKFSREDLKKQLALENFKRTTLSFYKYVIIDDPLALRERTLLEME